MFVCSWIAKYEKEKIVGSYSSLHELRYIFALLCDEVFVHLDRTDSFNKFHVLVEKLFIALWWKHSVQSNYAFLLSLKVKTWYEVYLFVFKSIPAVFK